MSKFLDVLERIRDGETAPLGFAAARAQKLPGIALVGLVSGDHAAGVAAAATADAVIVAGSDGPDGLKALAESTTSPWGPRVSALGEDDAQAYQEAGADLLVFEMEGTAASALASENIARVLCIETGIEEAELRAIGSLPVDAYLISMDQVSGAWTLPDLASLGSISRRTDKYVLVQVAQAPGKKDLEALRDMGVAALVVDVAGAGAEGLAELKTALLDMPRPASRSRARSRAILPGSAFTPPEAPPQEDDGDDDDDQ